MNFGEYLYNQLPAHYRYRDIETEYTLERYLQCLGEYINVVFEETDDIKDLLNVEKMPSKFLPYYAKMFGIKIYDDISEDFQRKLLANIVPILKRKGTRDVIEFVARELTGYDVDITEGHEYAFKTWIQNVYLPLGSKQSLTFDSTQAIHYRYAGSELTSRFIVYVEIHTTDIGATISEELIRRYLKDLVPSYVNVVFVLNQHYVDTGDYDEVANITVIESGFQDVEVVSDRTYGNVQYEFWDSIKCMPEVEDVRLHVTESILEYLTQEDRYMVNNYITEAFNEDKIKDLREVPVEPSPVDPVNPDKPDPTPVDPNPTPAPDPGTTAITSLDGSIVMGDLRFYGMDTYGSRYFKNMYVDANPKASANYFYDESTGTNRLKGYPINPTCIIILLGVNNAEVTGRVYMKNLLEALREKYPITPIYVLKEYHMGAYFNNGHPCAEMNKLIDEFNDATSRVCSSLNINHIAVDKRLYDSDGLLSREYSYDGCLMNQLGYDILWRNTKDAILNKENTKDDGKDDTPDTPIDELPSIPTDPKDPLYIPDRFTGTVTNNYQLMAKAYEILRHYNTCFLYGGVGQVITQNVVNAKAQQYPDFYTAYRKGKYAQYIDSTKRYWGFDAVALYKAILWGWTGDASKSYGGATYASNGVPDVSADDLFAYCTDKSNENWDDMPVGEVLWQDGHLGIYVGDGKCIECTLRWTRISNDGTEWNSVMLTAVQNCVDYPFDIKGRNWTKHGKLPFIQYLAKNPFCTASNTEQAGDTTGTLIGTTYNANITAYYPDKSKEGGSQDAIGNLLVGYPDQLTCKAPKNVPFGSKVKITGTGTKYDDLVFTVTDRDDDTVTDATGVYDISICLKTHRECSDFGQHNTDNVKAIVGDIVTSSRKVAIVKQECNVRSGAGTEYSILGTVNVNYRLTVLDDSQDWVAVEYLGKVAYLKGTLLSIVTI